MDSLITAAGRALAAGDALTALKRVALREDPPALALRGIAMAQLGELARAQDLLKRAARGFGPQEPLAQARCTVAEAEVALALRNLAQAPAARAALANAQSVLAQRGDIANAAHARLIAARRALLMGHLQAAADGLATLDATALAPQQRALAALVRLELALRGLQLDQARQALAQAQTAARQAGIPALQAEVADAGAVLDRVAARRWLPASQQWQPLRLADVATLLSDPDLVVDGCRHALHAGTWRLSLARRPVLFTLLQGLAEAWPQAATREHLIERAFRLNPPDDSHRARLRVEIGRLRRLVAPVVGIEATPQGFALQLRPGQSLALLAPPLASTLDAVTALLADGAAWSTSALALATGESQRQLQRSLAELLAQGRVRAIGQGRARRWLAPTLTGFTTILLLPAALPSG
ncbi:helix-turn-helix domain-containing protein [Roseateles puraquae]|uniref:Helix-turn-helix domain-containing protein n=1 Tax=Roseateles puraquae TaxID=431059 RepID=A0A254N520_9BURK|nr:helix-turn-helix domain-containing protein [Roseateles puraquae]MDG0856886.1 helix-turn-helix domain-containing protein [Roseateles puraquae]OWR03145.1 helix-turn-helix domain-containing protein [Roseateles puraquae]